MTLANINNPDTRQEFLKTDFQSNIGKLKISHRPLWGQMTAQQMVEHLIWTFDVSIGKIKVACSTPPEKIALYKRFLHTDIPTKQNFRNPELVDGLPNLLHKSLENAMASLQSSIEEFYRIYHRNPSKEEIHPIFGPLNFEEWERAHFKHCFHHLQQFELI